MKTVKSSELASFRMVASNEKKYDRVIDKGVVKQWVGFGWVTEEAPTDEERATLPFVVHEEK